MTRRPMPVDRFAAFTPQERDLLRDALEEFAARASIAGAGHIYKGADELFARRRADRARALALEIM